MAAWVNAQLEMLIKQLGGLETQTGIGNGFIYVIYDTLKAVITSSTRSGAVLTCDGGFYNNTEAAMSITSVGVYIQDDTYSYSGEAFYQETGLSDTLDVGATIACVSTVTFTR